MASISIKTAEDINGMRLAGRLAAEVLDFIEPHVKPGVTTGELDRLCHEYMVNVQGTIPAPLNYCPPGYTPFPKAICTSVNDVVCHGIPGDKVLKNGDVIIAHMNKPASDSAEGLAIGLDRLTAQGFQFVKLGERMHGAVQNGRFPI